MSTLDASPWRERALAVLRIAAGAMFITAGTMKLFGFPGTPMGPMPPAPIMSLMGAAGILEAFGGLLIVLGLLTRPVAFILSGEMAVAYFYGHVYAHAERSIFPTENGGMGAALYSLVFLYLVFAGAGAWSVDSAIRRRRGAAV